MIVPLIVFVIGLPLIFVLFAARRSRWITLLWLPLATLSGLYTFETLGLISVHDVSGRDGGFVLMAIMFTLLKALPGLVLFVLSVFAFPKREAWNAPYGGSAFSLTLLVVYAYHRTTTETIEFRVLDGAGNPVANCPLSFKTTRIESFSLGTGRTGRDGTIRFAHPKDEYLTVTMAEKTGTYGVTLEIESPDPSLPEDSPRRNIRHVRWMWSQYAALSTSFAETRDVKTEQPLIIYQRPSEAPQIPTLAAELKRMMGECLTNGKHARSLQNAGFNIESFDYIETLGEIAEQQPSLRNDAIHAMGSQASLLADLRKISQEVSKYEPWHGDRSWRDDDWIIPMRGRILTRWIGGNMSDPAKMSSNMEAVAKRIHENAWRLILASQPYWKDEDSSFTVVKTLGELGRPALALMPDAFREAHPRALFPMQDVLHRLEPTVEEVRGFVESGDPKLVFAGYEAARFKIRPNEARAAFDRLTKVRASGALDERQMKEAGSIIDGLDSWYHFGDPNSPSRNN